MRLSLQRARVAGVKLALRSGPRLRRARQCALLLSACLLIACSARPFLLDKIFDIPPPGQPDPGKAPVIRTARRTPFVDQSIPSITKEYQALMEERRKEGPARDWKEIYNKLPKDDDENIDWMAALTDKVIQPRGSIDADAPDPGKTKDAGTAKITMDAMDEGKYCGVCHDSVAIAQPASCKGCHKVKVAAK